MQRLADLSRCLLSGIWLPFDPRSVGDLFKSRRTVGHRTWACTGAESWGGSYIYCNKWSLRNSADPDLHYPVTVVCDEGDWLRSEGLNHARGSETCGGLVLALLLAYASGMWLEALFIAALAALLARPPGVKGHGP